MLHQFMPDQNEASEFPPLEAADLAWLTRCERRIWLDWHNSQPPAVTLTADARMRIVLRVAHQRRILASIEDASDFSALPWGARVIQTHRAIQQGVTAIAGAALEARLGDRLLRGAPDLLLRIPSTLPGAWTYQPAAIVLHTRPTRWDRFLLDAWRWLVQQTCGEEGNLPGELWLGANGNKPALIKRQSTPLTAFVSHMNRAATIAAKEVPAIWFDNDHCPFCPWRAICDATARETRDIALLPGLSRRQGHALRQRGIYRVDQVMSLDPAVLAALPERLPHADARLRLQAQALILNRPLPTGATIPPLPQVTFFLDIESDPQTREPWAFGLAGAPGERFVIIVGSSSNESMQIGSIPVVFARDVQEGWQRVLDTVRAAGGALAHWGEAERLLLKQSAGPHLLRELIPLMIDAQRELHRRVTLPVPRLSDQRSGGLKAIARWLGWTWFAGADHWTLAWEAYRQWRMHPSPADAFELLEPAIVYLAADVEALAAVWRWLDAFVASFNATDTLPEMHEDRDTAASREC